VSATIVWYRQDLRVHDQPALAAAARAGGPVVPVYVWAPEEAGEWAPGAASRWWLHGSLASLGGELGARGARLTLRQGTAATALAALAREAGAARVVCSRAYEPWALRQEEAVRRALAGARVAFEALPGRLLWEPVAVRGRSGAPLRVFTPFHRACLALGEPEAPLPPPQRLPAPAEWPAGEPLEALGLLPRVPWDAGLRAEWRPGRAGAAARLAALSPERLTRYPAERDFPAAEATSRLSPHLHFGEVSPREVWHAAGAAGAAGEAFRRQLAWREFAHHLLAHFPHTPTEPLRPEFAAFRWEDDPAGLEAWRRGQTGFPLVDAGLRQLWATGWMHNRVRMVVASFLVKDLLLPWQEGARWFWDTLVDADLANNTLGWQWTAGCGADAAPYFRVFNPVTQGEKFDPTGEYVRRWVPELAGLPTRLLHRPWTASASDLTAAGVRLGATYPHPVVDHAFARARALAALQRLPARTA